MSPLVESSPQIGLALPVERTDAVECQFVIHAHLVPGDLVDHHHRPFATEPIEDRPQPIRRLLLIERGPFVLLSIGELYLLILFALVICFLCELNQVAFFRGQVKRKRR